MIIGDILTVLFNNIYLGLELCGRLSLIVWVQLWTCWKIQYNHQEAISVIQSLPISRGDRNLTIPPVTFANCSLYKFRLRKPFLSHAQILLLLF